MSARDIEYVEFYVKDMAAAVEYFGCSLGFTRIAESTDRGGRSLLLRLGSAQLLITAGPVAREFLDAHGDGVVDIALACDDVHATVAAGVAAGVLPLDTGSPDPVLPGFGGVRHTLLPARPGPGHRLPPGRSWSDSAPAARQEGPGDRIKALDHVAICLEAGTLDAHADMYADVFGLSRYSSEYTVLGDQAMESIVVRSPSYGITFTLLAQDPARSHGQIEAFIDRNSGSGVQHLAFEVDDIIPAVREFQGKGIDFLGTPASYYDMLLVRFPEMSTEVSGLRETSVLADRDEWGYLLQLFTRSPYERNTLFYELIQRRGARGFGGANIRALYEAVERDRMTAR